MGAAFPGYDLGCTPGEETPVSDTVKLAVIYYSSTGTVDAMARRAAQAAEKAGAEVRVRHVAELAPDEVIDQQPAWREHLDETAGEPRATPDDVLWADAVLFGSPTRFGNVSSQLKQFLDTLGPQWGEGLLADKTYAGFTAAQTQHGGHESTLLALYNTLHHFGGILVSPGYTDPVKFADGNPYGVSHATGPDNDAPLDDAEEQALEHLAERVVRVTAQLLRGRTGE
jgi:NAD(P)H dehydrogenase (quinone)